MKLFAGCYERFLFGFDISVSPTGDVELTKSFCQPAHRSAVKCIDAAGSYVVTGGADDQIHLFNMAKTHDLGFLVNPVDGAIPSIRLFAPPGKAQPTHLLTGTTEGSICIWKAAGKWDHLKVMKGHKGAVNSMAVHPSGALALSVSRDKQMRLWDLTKGACAYQAPIGGEGDLVQFLPGGDLYAIASGTTLSVHSTKGELVGKLQHSRKVLACAALSEDVLITGCEGGSLQVWDVRAAACSMEHPKAHASRIRDATLLQLPGRSGACLASVSSDGAVKLWDVEALRAGSVSPLAEQSVGARFTCVAHMRGAGGAKAAKAGVKAGMKRKMLEEADAGDDL